MKTLGFWRMTDYSSHGKNRRAEVSFSLDNGRRAGSFAIHSLREKTPGHVLRDYYIRRWLSG